MGVVDDCLSKNTESEQSVTPANVERQREILGRTSLRDPAGKYTYPGRRTWRPGQDGAATPRKDKKTSSNKERPAWQS